MTLSIFRLVAPAIPTLALVVSLAQVSSAQYPGEQIVGMQVVSDTVAADNSTPAKAASYVGDMAPEVAGVGFRQGVSTGAVVDGGVVYEGGASGGIGQPRKYGNPDLFYNYYTQGYSNQANAQLYVSPHPVPAFVGQTFFTYQPFYPHHYLYGHSDRYHNYYDNGRGTNRTRVSYSTHPVRSAASNLYWNVLRIPR